MAIKAKHGQKLCWFDWAFQQMLLIELRNGTGTYWAVNAFPIRQEGWNMPRFYFHICDDEGMSRDEEGTELPDLDAARREARASARDLASQYLKNRKPITGQTLQIADETGKVLETMEVRAVLN
jgi:hypothetical protein